MRHPFIKKAKKNSYLIDLIDRHRKWKITRGDETDSDSGGESGGEQEYNADLTVPNFKRIEQTDFCLFFSAEQTKRAK